MQEQTVSMTIEGMDELQQSLVKLINKYPDRAGELLRKDALKLRKDVVAEVKRVTDTNASSKRSLAKLGSYKISPVIGIGANQQVEISAKSPHFHLVEHGHVLKTPKGKTIGFVQGKHMMETTIKQHERELPKVVEDMVDDLLRQGGLL